MDPIRGLWRIVDTDVSDTDAIDLLGPAFVEFTDEGQGAFRLIAVEGEMDVRRADHLGANGVEFSWEGHDDGDPASGRGWAMVSEDGSLIGRIFFHLGDESAFRAVRQ